MQAREAALQVDWLAISRRAAGRVRSALERYPLTSDRARETGRGEGGDIALAIDRAAEDEVLAELRDTGLGLTVVSEERGRVELAGGGPAHVVVDPIDGSLNAKRGLPFYALSIAVADGPAMADVGFGYVCDLAGGEEWWARSGEGAVLDGEPLAPLRPDAPLEVLGVETARPERLAAAAPAHERTGARRVRTLGSVALALCFVAAARMDAMATLRPVRSVDVAAAQLLVREAGGAVAFPGASEDPSLGLEMRAPIVAAASPLLADRAAVLVETGAVRAVQPPWRG